MSAPHRGPGPVQDTVPYPWPWCGALDPSRAALLIVSAPRLPGVNEQEPFPALAGAVSALRAAGVLIATAATAPPPARRFRPAGETVALDGPADLAVTAPGWDGFHGTPLDTYLRAAGRDQLVLAGWWLETAVHSTLRSANDRGYECLLATDWVAGLDPVTTQGAISSIRMSGGIFGATGEGRAVLATLSTLPASAIDCTEQETFR